MSAMMPAELFASFPSPAGRNEPLKKDRPKWKSDYPMTEGQLRSKRDEFWDTAPAFEGRKEIWDALKAAAVALECNDHELAQAIVDGASITLPHGEHGQWGEKKKSVPLLFLENDGLSLFWRAGTLTECYDELGNRYQLPVYCLAPPVNLISERSDEDTSDSPEPSVAPKKEFQLKVLMFIPLHLVLYVRNRSGMMFCLDILQDSSFFFYWPVDNFVLR